MDKKREKLIYGYYKSPFGRCCIAFSADGICSLSFGRTAVSDILRIAEKKGFGGVSRNDRAVSRFARKIFSFGEGDKGLSLDLFGTVFQKKVWMFLVRLPFGSTVSYSEVAAGIGNKKAVRAAATAIASNPVGFLVPCHRVIGKNGDLGGFAWGMEMKQAMLYWEREVIRRRRNTD